MKTYRALMMGDAGQVRRWTIRAETPGKALSQFFDDLAHGDRPEEIAVARLAIGSTRFAAVVVKAPRKTKSVLP